MRTTFSTLDTVISHYAQHFGNLFRTASHDLRRAADLQHGRAKLLNAGIRLGRCHCHLVNHDGCLLGRQPQS